MLVFEITALELTDVLRRSISETRSSLWLRAFRIHNRKLIGNSKEWVGLILRMRAVHMNFELLKINIHYTYNMAIAVNVGTFQQVASCRERTR